MVFAPPILAFNFTIAGPGDLTLNMPCSANDDTINVLNFNLGDVLSGTWNGQGGTNTINLKGDGNLQALISNFQVLNKTEFGDWHLDTDIDLGAGGTTTVSGDFLGVHNTLTTNTATIQNGGFLAVTGTFNCTTLQIDAGGEIFLTGTATATTSTTVSGTLEVLGNLNSTAITITNGGLLIIDWGGTFTFTTATVQGGGTLNWANAIVAGGSTLTVNGTLTSPTVTVGATGTLGGAGQITGNVINNGNVAPGNSIGTITVAGNYAQGAGATLQVEINSNGTNDLLHATGTATLAGTLAIATTGTYTGSNQHVVVQADGGIIGTFDTVTGLAGGNTLRHRFGVSYTATQVVVGVTVLTYESLVRGYGGRPVSVAICLDTIANSATGDMGNIINQLDHLPDVASLAAAFQQLHCGPYHAFKTINFNTQHLFTALSQARLFQVRTGVAVTGTTAGFSNPNVGPLLAYSGNLGRLGRLLASDATPAAVQDRTIFAGPPSDVLRTAFTGRRLGIWVRPFGIIEDQDSVDGNAGYNFTTTGFAAGFDYRFTPHFIAGISLGYATSRVKYDDAGGSRGEVQSYSAGVYGTWFGPRWFVEFSISYASNSFDMDRKIKFGGVDRTATSDYRGSALTAQLGGGYDFPLGRSWTMGPVLSLEAVYQEQEGFSESGAGALNLRVGRRTATSVRSAVGVRVKRVWRGDKGRRVTLSLSVLWVHEFADDAQGVNASLQGNPATPFTVTTPEPERDAVRLGIGVTARLTRRVALFAAYQPEFRKDNQSHYASAGVRIEF